MATAAHVLVIDDDERLRTLLYQYLSENGFWVSTAGSAVEARHKLESIQFDLLIVDVMMPGETGLDLTESIRRRSKVPILMLTAMGETEDRIAGLERGADDYLAKPFEPRELLLRLRTILRRIEETRPAEAMISLGACRFDSERGELFREGERVRLTESESRLLTVLAQRPGEVYSRTALLARTEMEGGDRAVDVQVTRLRRKIEPDPKEPRYLQTVRGKGYTLVPD